MQDSGGGVDGSTSILNGSTNIVVNPGPFSGYWMYLPTDATAGVPFNVTVSAVDAYRNFVTYSGTTHLGSTDAQALLPPDYSQNLPGLFQRDFPIMLGTAGVQTLTVTDEVTSIYGYGQINVHHAGVTQFQVAVPANTSAGTAFGFTVTAQDAFRNLAFDYIGKVHSTSSEMW